MTRIKVGSVEVKIPRCWTTKRTREAFAAGYVRGLADRMHDGMMSHAVARMALTLAEAMPEAPAGFAVGAVASMLAVAKPEIVSVLGDILTAPPGGVCRVCGCTDDRACVDGCAWADETHTICTCCAGASDATSSVAAAREESPRGPEESPRGPEESPRRPGGKPPGPGGKSPATDLAICPVESCGALLDVPAGAVAGFCPFCCIGIGRDVPRDPLRMFPRTTTPPPWPTFKGAPPLRQLEPGSFAARAAEGIDAVMAAKRASSGRRKRVKVQPHSEAWREGYRDARSGYPFSDDIETTTGSERAEYRAGFEAAGKPPAPSSPPACPRCFVVLEATTDPRGPRRWCPSCGWKAPSSPPPCPKCGAPLGTFEGLSGRRPFCVMCDVAPECGTVYPPAPSSSPRQTARDFMSAAPREPLICELCNGPMDRIPVPKGGTGVSYVRCPKCDPPIGELARKVRARVLTVKAEADAAIDRLGVRPRCFRPIKTHTCAPGMAGLDPSCEGCRREAARLEKLAAKPSDNSTSRKGYRDTSAELPEAMRKAGCKLAVPTADDGGRQLAQALAGSFSHVEPLIPTVAEAEARASAGLRALRGEIACRAIDRGRLRAAEDLTCPKCGGELRALGEGGWFECASCKPRSGRPPAAARASAELRRKIDLTCPKCGGELRAVPCHGGGFECASCKTRSGRPRARARKGGAT